MRCLWRVLGIIVVLLASPASSQSAGSSSPPLEWDDFVEQVLTVYREQRLEGRFKEGQDRHIHEFGKHFKGMAIKGRASFSGLAAPGGENEQGVDLKLVTPLEPPFVVTSRIMAGRAAEFEALPLGSDMVFQGVVSLVGTGYFTQQRPFGGQPKRVQFIAIVISHVRKVDW